MKLSLPPKSVEKLVWVWGISFCKISFPVMHWNCSPHAENLEDKKDICRVMKTQHQSPLFGHKKGEISEGSEVRRTLSFSRYWKLRLASHLTKSEFHLVFFFPDCLQPITVVVFCCCTAGINIFKPHAFNLEFQRFIPKFNKISLLCR
jgi:hypothetical protein